MDNAGILLVAAHDSEAKALESSLDYQRNEYEVLVTGVGGISMAWALQKRLTSGQPPKLAVNAGIAGSYKHSLNIGQVVLAASDCFADLGVDDNGKFSSLFSAGLADPNRLPFTDGKILCHNKWFDRLVTIIPAVEAATVNMASGSEEVIERIRSTWNPAIETMEGAYFAYICSMAQIPYVCLRSVSNIVEPRQKKSWNISSALKALEEIFPSVIKILEER
jgi:futalosine hydrolase